MGADWGVFYIFRYKGMKKSKIKEIFLFSRMVVSPKCRTFVAVLEQKDCFTV